MIAQSARADASQNVSWGASAQSGFSVNGAVDAVALAAGARVSAKVKVTAPSAGGNYTLTFHPTSTLGVNPPPYVLPVIVKN